MQNNQRKVCVFTGTRADYGLLSLIIKGLQEHSYLQLQLLVSGSHLSEKFGYTVKAIKEDGYPVDAEVALPLEDDSDLGVCRAMGVAVPGFAEQLQRLKPDLALLLGDRFEALCFAQAALMLKIPIAHIHGGEKTEGALDESIRHAITKMSHLHFVSTPEYRRRVIQMGEHPDRVFCVGAPGVEVIKNIKLRSKSELEQSLGFSFDKPLFLVTYHPETQGGETAQSVDELILALNEFSEASVLLTYPNADADNGTILRAFKGFKERFPDRVSLVDSLGQQNYLSLMNLAQVVVGNSSSGLIEAPTLGTPTVNIGSRQRGRILAASVISCEAKKCSIVKAIRSTQTEDFRCNARQCQNPYEQPGTSKKILSLIAELDMESLGPKSFVDI